MKQNGWILVIVLLVLVFGLIDTPIKPSGFLRPLVGKWIGGLTEEARPTPTIQPDVATLSQDEVCALVYNYLQGKATAMTRFTLRQHLLGVLDTTRPYFVANYKGNGKWQVQALGCGIKDQNWVFNYDGLWNLYEASRAIEPANDQATRLLSYIRR